MKFCLPHWTKMRAAIEARGMTPLVAENGQSAIANLADELQRGQTLDNFDPLMAMHWNIVNNVMEKLGQNAFYLLGAEDAPEDPIDVEKITAADAPALRVKYAGKTWPRCPLCYINIAHEFTCDGSKPCDLPRENGYDIAIEWSADVVKAAFDKLMNT